MRLIRIHSGKSVSPDAFVAVKYRDSWFWIDDNDLDSKQVFSLIMMLFTTWSIRVQSARYGLGGIGEQSRLWYDFATAQAGMAAQN